jgi:DNA repair protein RecO (recombination protein O)
MPRQPRSFRVEAVVLRHSDWGEADRLLSIYTRDQGKLRAIAKGARKVRSRKAGHLEPFTRVNLLLARGRQLYIVTQAETVDAYLSLRDDLTQIGYASYVLELLDRFTYEEEEHGALYRLLVDTLARLDQADDPRLVLRYYEIRLLDFLGYRPELIHCVECEEPIAAADQYFSPARGGILCPNCGPRIGSGRPASMQALKYLRHFQRSTYREAARAQLSPAVQQELENLMSHYLTYLLERGLNTPAFIERVRKEPTDP